ncbi:MAG: hypothetical protein KF805_05110 [Phycisphaeraceae bacterium]|nr:hypothetical protein [Phycisphaeraceae bacterium]
MKSTPRFILVDQSLRSFGGHYFNYATRVLEAAARAGFEARLICNRAFKGGLGEGIDVSPAFRYSTFETAIATPRSIREFALRTRRVFASVRANAVDWWRDSRFAFKAVIAMLALLCIPLVAAGALVAVVAYALLTILNRLRHEPKVRAFERDLSRAMPPLAPGDVGFLPTISAPELLGFARFLTRFPTARLANWHVVLRQDTPESSPRKRREFLRGVRAVAVSIDPARLRWWSDTEALRDAWEAATGLGFETLPIPVGDSFRPEAAAFGAGQVEGGPLRPLRIVYVGDARKEKGFHVLPSVARSLRESGHLEGETVLVVQSSVRVIDPEPECLRALQDLKSFGKGVRFVTNELNDEEYASLVRGAHVMLLLYEAAAYRRRSSGILAEAMASGVPVLVPEGTWLASSVREMVSIGARPHPFVIDADEDAGARLVELLKDWPRLRLLALGASEPWRARHNPDALVRRLLESCGRNG